MLCRRISCLVSWTNQSYVNLSWSILIKSCLARIETIAALRAQGRDCTNSSSTWLYMLPHDCSCFHSGHYIICWHLQKMSISLAGGLSRSRARVGWFACPCLHAIYEPVPKFAPPHGDETLIEGYFPTFDR